jgi:hypothetical protein
MKEDGEAAPEVNAVVGKPASVSELNTLLLKLTASAAAPHAFARDPRIICEAHN